jgi:hypothetical protein
MFVSKANFRAMAARRGAWGGLAVLGLLLAGCQSSSQDPSSPASPSPAPPPGCDSTVPLNHCGAYMPQYNPNNHS